MLNTVFSMTISLVQNLLASMAILQLIIFVLLIFGFSLELTNVFLSSKG